MSKIDLYVIITAVNSCRLSAAVLAKNSDGKNPAFSTAYEVRRYYNTDAEIHELTERKISSHSCFR